MPMRSNDNAPSTSTTAAGEETHSQQTRPTTNHRTKKGRLHSIRVTEVNCENVDSVWPFMLLAIRRASLIAIDLELSGLGARGGLHAKSVEERYLAIKAAAETRSVLSVGIAVFELVGTSQKKKRTRFKCQVFNLLTLCDEPFTMEPDALRFLREHNFDFNRLVRLGIRYLPFGGVIGKLKNSCSNNVLSTLWSEVLQSSVPLAFHNGLVDVVFLYRHFYAKLPEDLGSLLTDLADWFDKPSFLMDSKYLADYSLHLPASYLEYLFRKCQRDNAREASGGKAYVSVEFEPIAFVSVKSECCEVVHCPLPNDSNLDHFCPVSTAEQLCKTFSAHGFCHQGRLCPKLHDVDKVLDLEECRRGKRNRRKRKRVDMANGGDSVDNDDNNATGTEVSGDSFCQAVSAKLPTGQGSKTNMEGAPRLITHHSNNHHIGPQLITSDASFHANGCHRAGVDAFMTGFSVLYMCRMSLLRTQLLAPADSGDINKLPLSGKDNALTIQRSQWAKNSDRHCEKWPHIKAKRRPM